MEFNEAIYDRIHKHLHNQLSKADREDFEQMMSQNPDLVSEVEKHKYAESMVVDAYLLDLRGHTQSVLHHKRQQANLKKWLGGGSMAFMLSAGIATYMNFTQKPSNITTQQLHINTMKDSSVISKTQPSPTIETKKPAHHKVVVPKQAAPTIEKVPSAPGDLDKEAQLLYLKQLEQRQKEPTTSRNPDQKPSAPTSTSDGVAQVDKKQVAPVEESGSVSTPAPELLFELVYEIKQGAPLEIPTGGIDIGKFKIVDESGVVIYEADFDTKDRAYWNGQVIHGSLSYNKQLNVLIFNSKNQVHGLGKISVVY